MNTKLRDADYLEHILDAIDRALRYVGDVDENEFMSNDLVQDAVIRNLEIIGEAVGKLSPGFKTDHGEIPWAEIAGMRNRLIHAYMSVNLAIVWDTVSGILPDLREKILTIQQQVAR